MQAPCFSAPIHSDHWDACVADAVVIAGDLIPGLITNTLSYEDIRRVITGVHACHVMALALQLANEMANRGLSRDDVRQYMLIADVVRAMS